MDLPQSDYIKFLIQDEEHKVRASDVTPETSLNQYLREKAQLTGTKNMCLEGGCGTCVVAVTLKDALTEKDTVLAVNSCLVSIFSCHGWNVATIEGIGNPLKGYHKVQKVLAQFNGTQCGFCSPGMAMNMYALIENKQPTMKEVENAFSGNICRCTGYRPILSAFKSLAKDVDAKLLGTYPIIPDIEDVKVCPKTKKQCKEICTELSTKPLLFQLSQSKWIKLFTINDLLDVFISFPTSTYMLVAGNTAHGVYPRIVNPDIYIDITSVKALKEYQIQHDKLIVGAGMSLNEAIDLFYKTAIENKDFSYLKLLADHIDLIANVPVRNIGTLAGNLMLKYEHNEFPSDLFLVLATAAATMTIVTCEKKEILKPVDEFLTYDMKRKVIKNIILPARDGSFKYNSFKIMIRAQNSHALVNAGFLLQLDNKQVVQSARIIYGCINPSFVHATNTEKHLIGKKLFDNGTLQRAYAILDEELKPDSIVTESSILFRKGLAISLFYKYVLSIAPDNAISPRNKGAGMKMEDKRPISSGVQDFETNESLYPLTEPIPKIEALAQTSGQAEYIFDMPDSPHQLFAAFVLAKAPAYTRISKIDPTEALKLEGVVAFYDKNDIPGANNFIPVDTSNTSKVTEEIFSSGTIQYYFQPVGLIVAKSEEVAQKAADIVKIIYTPGNNKPLLTIRDILKANATDQIIHEMTILAKTKGNDIKHVIHGKLDIGWQYHYQMETQICNVVPTEDGFNMYPSTQWMNLAQNAASLALNIPSNKFNVSVKRLGGAYGSKITRNSLVSTAAAIAAYKLNKPVKLRMPFVTNMNVVGKRFPCSCDYEVGVNDKGVIQYLKIKQYSDYGAGGNENISELIVSMMTNKYDIDTWEIAFNSTRSNNHAGTWCRAPGSAEGLAMIESVMEHIAHSIKVDPLDVRIRNLKKGNKIAQYIEELKSWADIDKRKEAVAIFNKNNRWVKKGLAVVPMIFDYEIFGNWSVFVSIYHHDGTVAISHGGIEMGQGINTKAVQVCAYELGISLDKVSVKPSNNLIGANSTFSGSSLTSQAVCYGVKQACSTLLKRIEPYRVGNPTWEELIQKCFVLRVDLTATAMYSLDSPNVHPYQIFGVGAAEVEVDILTGLHIVSRVDILEDAGNSMSPVIDIGQVEGAFVMGQGYYTTEELIFDKQGQLLTNRTWNYKPPGAKDIPVDFRVKFPKNNPNPVGVLKSKATAEPPLCLSVSIPFAVRNAVASARNEADPSSEKWYPFYGPSTVENTFLNSMHNYKQYTL